MKKNLLSVQRILNVTTILEDLFPRLLWTPVMKMACAALYRWLAKAHHAQMANHSLEEGSAAICLLLILSPPLTSDLAPACSPPLALRCSLCSTGWWPVPSTQLCNTVAHTCVLRWGSHAGNLGTVAKLVLGHCLLCEYMSQVEDGRPQVGWWRKNPGAPFSSGRWF